MSDAQLFDVPTHDDTGKPEFTEDEIAAQARKIVWAVIDGEGDVVAKELKVAVKPWLTHRQSEDALKALIAEGLVERYTSPGRAGAVTHYRKVER